jgi:GDP-L-fucose synthase
MIFDKEKPDGQFKKTANNYKLLLFLPNFQFNPIKKGITKTIEWFVKNYNLCRK